MESKDKLQSKEAYELMTTVIIDVIRFRQCAVLHG